jgi:ABC-2 type transport system permease protein
MALFNLLAKDLKRSLRNPFALGMMFMAPLVITGLIWVAFGGVRGDMPSLSVGIVNLDRVATGSPLEAPVGDSVRDMFHDPSVKGWIKARDFATEAEARRAVEARVVGVAVVVPADFSEALLAGEDSSPVTILEDPTLSIGPRVVRSMIASLLDGVAGGGIAYRVLAASPGAGRPAPSPAAVAAAMREYEDWYRDFQRNLFHDPAKAALVLKAPAKEGADAMKRLIALIMAGQLVFFAFFTGANAMLGIVSEEEDGTLARLFATPVARPTIIAGRFLSVLATVLVQGLCLAASGAAFFGISWGRPASVALALAGQVLAASGLGVLLIAFVRTSRQGGLVLGGALTVLGMLGGLFSVAVSMPAFFERLNLLTPQGWVLRSWRVALDGAGATLVLAPALVASLVGAGCFAMGAILFGRRLSQGGK